MLLARLDKRGWKGGTHVVCTVHGTDLLCSLFTRTRLSRLPVASKVRYIRYQIVLHQYPNTHYHKMALLVDKHRPKSLDQLTYHTNLSERLRSLVCYCSPSTIKMLTLPGPKRRLPSPPSVRPLRSREENTDCCNTQGTLRTGCRENQDRRESLPDDLEPQTRIQRRRVQLPPRDHALGRGPLGPGRRAGSAQGGGPDAAGRPECQAEIQGRGHQ